MKKTKIVIPAMGMLLLGTAASVTGTVAWFSMNQSVQVSGMQVKTKVSDNLLIAGDTLASTAKKVDADFGPGPLEQSVKGILEPVSTVNGTSFWYTKVANADGSKASGDWTEYTSAAATDTTNYDSAFSEYYGLNKTDANTTLSGETGAKPYVDYAFQLKAVNSSSSAQNLKVTALTLTYGSVVNGSNAFRTAFFVEDITSANPAGGVGTLNMIYAPSGADNQETGKAVSAASATAAVTYNTANTNLASVPATQTKQYKIVVRLWIEGEDKACTNATFAALSNTWALSLECSLGGSTNPVSALATA